MLPTLVSQHPLRGDDAQHLVGRRLKRLSIVIPAYNEESTIETLVRNVQAVELDGLEKEIIIVDDHSTDGTRERLRQFGSAIRVICHPRNLGKGAAVRSGFQTATGDILIRKLLRKKRRIAEVPIHYHPRLYREGKKIRWQHGLTMIWTILKWRVLPF